MTTLLASVANLGEVKIACETDVGIIDLKNPALGALGAWDYRDLVRAVHLVDGVKPVSATIGDLPMVPEYLCAAVTATAATGVDFVKVGFFPDGSGGGDGWPCAEAIGNCDTGAARLVAVLFADQNPDFSLVEELATNGFFGVMLDTADKNGGSIRDYLEDNLLAQFVETVMERGLFSGLAGSLTLDDVLPLLKLGPDCLGFRGALCGSESRQGNLDAHALGGLVSVFQDWNTSSPSRATATAGAQAAACSLS